MRVLVHDRVGPRSLPSRIAVAGTLCIVGPAVAAWLSPIGSMGSAVLIGHLGFVLLSLAVAAPFRFGPRVVNVSVRPGEVHVRRGLGSLRIRPRDVSGATTCHHEGNPALTLVLGEGHHAGVPPVSLLFETPADAERVRAALGIARDGLGETHFPTEMPATVRIGRVFGAIALVLAVATLAPYFVERSLLGLILAAVGLGIPCFLLALIQYLHPNATRMRRIALRADAVYLPTPGGFVRLPYGAIRRVHHRGRTLIVEPEEGPPIPTKTLLPPEECAVLVSHVEEGRRRAMGDSTRQAEVDEQLSLLMPGAESIEAWIARLDGMAAVLSIPGYRGSSLDREVLRTTLDDIDSPVPLRFAAGRLLVKTDPEIRTRVAQAADTSPSEAHAKLFRACDGAAAEVAQAYAEIEEVETQSRGRSAAVAMGD